MKGFRGWHKLIAMLVAAQLLVWLITGLLLGQTEHGKSLSSTVQYPASIQTVNLIAPTQVLADYADVKQIALITVAGQPVYRMLFNRGEHPYFVSQYSLLDAVSGEPFTLSAAQAEHIAVAQFEVPTRVIQTHLRQPPIADLPRERNAVWQVALADDNHTHIYVRDNSGQIAGVVNDATRWRNLLTMLHFMDYWQTGSFNHALIQLFAIAAMLLCLTGGWWLIQLFRQGLLFNPAFDQSRFVCVIDPEGNEQTITCNRQQSLLSALHAQEYPVASVCGGGGMCGRCRVKLSPSSPVLSADKQLISEPDLAAGIRLSCQHAATRVTNVEVLTITK